VLPRRLGPIYYGYAVHNGPLSVRGLNADHLVAVAAVAELGSFSAAAQRLNLTQPAVSVQIRQLERRLGVRLFERVGRRVEPTVAGQNLLPHLRRIDEAVAAGLGCGLVLRRDKLPNGALREAVAALRALAQPGSTSQTVHSRHSRSSSSRLVGTS
jgi:DNA-binding transcriptional LysR family regulator